MIRIEGTKEGAARIKKQLEIRDRREKSHPFTHSEKTKKKVLAELDKGTSNAQINRDTGVGLMSIGKIRKQYRGR